MMYRVVPSSFDPIKAQPSQLAPEHRWTSWEAFLDAKKPRAVLYLLPAYLQLEPLAHAACRARKIPIFAIDPRQEAIIEEALQALPLDAAIGYIPLNIPNTLAWFLVVPESSPITYAASPNLWIDRQKTPGIPV